MRRDPGRYHIYLLTLPNFNSKQMTIGYLTDGMPAQDLQRAADFQAPPSDGQGVLVIAMPQQLDDLRAIKARVPGGQEQSVRAPTGRPLIYVYRVPPTG